LCIGYSVLIGWSWSMSIIVMQDQLHRKVRQELVSTIIVLAFSFAPSTKISIKNVSCSILNWNKTKKQKRKKKHFTQEISKTRNYVVDDQDNECLSFLFILTKFNILFNFKFWQITSAIYCSSRQIHWYLRKRNTSRYQWNVCITSCKILHLRRIL
jgi:hypothetical protein